MKPDIYTEDFSVRSYECAPDGTVRFPNILNFFQEAASNHAKRLGFDFPVIDEATGERGAWVLAQIVVHMDRHPRWRDVVRIHTFPRAMRGLFAHRDFTVALADGTVCGKGTSRWMVLNMETRRAVRLPASVTAYDEAPAAPLFGETEPFTRLRYPAETPEGESRREYRVMRSHIDINGHVNNVHYVNWMLESVPGDIDASLHVSDIEIAYRSETLYGESVSTRCAPLGGNSFLHRVCTLDGASDHILALSKWA